MIDSGCSHSMSYDQSRFSSIDKQKEVGLSVATGKQQEPAHEATYKPNILGISKGLHHSKLEQDLTSVWDLKAENNSVYFGPGLPPHSEDYITTDEGKRIDMIWKNRLPYVPNVMVPDPAHSHSVNSNNMQES